MENSPRTFGFGRWSYHVHFPTRASFWLTLQPRREAGFAFGASFARYSPIDAPPTPHSLFANTEDEYIPDAESVRLQRERHHQPQTCTLSQCFQLYTKEERVRGAAGAAGGGGGAAERQRVPGAPGLGADAGSAGMAGSAPSPRTLSARVFKCLEKVDDGLKCSRNEPL